MSSDENIARLVDVLNNDGLAVVRTDTIYGIIAKAASEKAVEKVYALKQRNLDKPCIVLLSSAAQAPAHADILAAYSARSSRPTTVVIPASTEPAWLLRGGNTMAYRVVRDDAGESDSAGGVGDASDADGVNNSMLLAKVIAAVGPVIAPSANRQGEPPFRTIDAARQQFGEAIDYYCDGGVVPEVVQPSRIIRVTNVNKGNSHDDSDSRGSTNAGSSGNAAIEIIRP